MKRSSIFWSILFILAQIALGFYWLPGIVILHFFLSLFLVGVAIAEEMDDIPYVFFLTPVMGISAIQAEQCALIIHHNGKCSVKGGSYEKLKPLCEAIQDRKISATIE